MKIIDGKTKTLKLKSRIPGYLVNLGLFIPIYSLPSSKSRIRSKNNHIQFTIPVRRLIKTIWKTMIKLVELECRLNRSTGSWCNSGVNIDQLCSHNRVCVKCLCRNYYINVMDLLGNQFQPWPCIIARNLISSQHPQRARKAYFLLN